MEAEKGSILCNSKGKTKVAGRASLTTKTTEEGMDFLDHSEQVLSVRDCPRCGPRSSSGVGRSRRAGREGPPLGCGRIESVGSTVQRDLRLLLGSAVRATCSLLLPYSSAHSFKKVRIPWRPSG